MVDVGYLMDNCAVEPDDPVVQVCYVCDQPILDPEDAHWVHEPGCPNFYLYRDEMSWVDCDCDLVAHPECCPMCKKVDEEVQSV